MIEIVEDKFILNVFRFAEKTAGELEALRQQLLIVSSNSCSISRVIFLVLPLGGRSASVKVCVLEFLPPISDAEALGVS